MFELGLAAARAVQTRVPLMPRPAYGLAFLAVAGAAIGTALFCPPAKRTALAWLLFPAAVLWLLAGRELDPLSGALLVGATLLLGGSLLGSVIGNSIEHPGHLLFVAIVSGAADTVSVVHPAGPSAAIAQSRAALALFALQFPMFGTENIEPLLGAGDVVFTALYIACARRHGLGLRRTALALSGAYAVTMCLVLALERAVPALPIFGLAMVLALPAARKPPARDRVRGFALSALVVAAAAAALLR